jgi:hypothetical protein
MIAIKLIASYARIDWAGAVFDAQKAILTA